MYKLSHRNEIVTNQYFSKLPFPVQLKIHDILNILDDAYGADRNITNDLGGYVVLLESSNDIESLKNTISVNLQTATFEYIDVMLDYLGCLLLLGSDYHLYIVLPYSIAPPNILSQINP